MDHTRQRGGLARVLRHPKSKILTPPCQPIKCWSLLELLGDWRTSRRANINSTSRVMLAESGQCAHANNLLNCQSGCELALNNFTLIFKDAKAGNRQQHDSVILGGRKHGPPL